MKKLDKKTLANIRRAVADYMWSEGCGCCGDYEAHKRDRKTLARLLNVPRYSDKSEFATGIEIHRFDIMST